MVMQHELMIELEFFQNNPYTFATKSDLQFFFDKLGLCSPNLFVYLCYNATIECKYDEDELYCLSIRTYCGSHTTVVGTQTVSLSSSVNISSSKGASKNEAEVDENEQSGENKNGALLGHTRQQFNAPTVWVKGQDKRSKATIHSTDHSIVTEETTTPQKDSYGNEDNDISYCVRTKPSGSFIFYSMMSGGIQQMLNQLTQSEPSSFSVSCVPSTYAHSEDVPTMAQVPKSVQFQIMHEMKSDQRLCKKDKKEEEVSLAPERVEKEEESEGDSVGSDRHDVDLRAEVDNQKTSRPTIGARRRGGTALLYQTLEGGFEQMGKTNIGGLQSSEDKRNERRSADLRTDSITSNPTTISLPQRIWVRRRSISDSKLPKIGDSFSS
jgi:hypothetical protein